jgi:hypothetical protein
MKELDRSARLKNTAAPTGTPAMPDSMTWEILRPNSYPMAGKYSESLVGGVTINA